MDLRRMLSLAALFALAGTLFAHATPPQTADALFTRAKAEAQHEHKDILLVFSASWCGPCKLYERYLEDPTMKPIIEKAFVIERIDVGERASDLKHANTPGGTDLRSALGATSEPGFPFLVITDEKGKPIINSCRNGDTSGNVGYPALLEEIDWYVEMFKRATPSLSPEDLAATRTWLKKHSPH